MQEAITATVANGEEGRDAHDAHTSAGDTAPHIVGLVLQNADPPAAPRMRAVDAGHEEGRRSKRAAEGGPAQCCRNENKSEESALFRANQ